MIDPSSLNTLNHELEVQMEADAAILNQLRAEIAPLKNATRRIQPRATTSISLVAADGGNNKLEFDPFMVQLVRVVDSSNNEYCLEVVSPTSDIDALSKRQFDETGKPITALGGLMQYLGVEKLWQLSTMMPRPTAASASEAPKPTWVQVYRELVEWAILFQIVRNTNFGSDTLIVKDGFLRSKVFARDLFAKYRSGMEEGIAQHLAKKRRVFVVGIAKHSKVLQRYRLAMAIEGVMDVAYSCYVEIPREIEEKAYIWSEYARGDEEAETGEANKFVAGKMFFVKFGTRPRDPIWPIDLLQSQAADAAAVMGYLLADATDGFPVPFYPQCLQRAHENAALVDFDMEILQQGIFKAIKKSLGKNAPVLDVFRLAGGDPSAKRYNN